MSYTTPQGTTPGPTVASATIYQFPVGGRDALGAHRRNGHLAAEVAAARVTVMGSAWYHEAAIEDAKGGYEH